MQPDKRAPLVLIRTVASRQLVANACEHAIAAGIAPGMTLAESHALCGGLVHADHRPDKDLQSLHSLARWMVRFSPSVAVEPPDALLLDVTGSELFFCGLDRLLALASASLTRMKLHHGIAIAPTPGAAFALASFHQKKRGLDAVFTIDQLPSVLSPLPISALRLDDDLNHAFLALGIETIGQLMLLPRQTLPARFGDSVLNRLDQALGHSTEPLAPIAHSQPIITKIEFEGGIESLGDLLMAGKHLLHDILHQLRGRGCGARTLVVEFSEPRRSPVTKTISLSRPAGELATLWNLLRCVIETVKSGDDGFTALQLSVPLFERMTTQQLDLLQHEAQIAEGEVDHLIERLRIRLGETAVVFPQAVESHLPEKAVCFQGERPLIKLHRETSAMNGVFSPFVLFAAQPPKKACKARPLHLLPTPIEVRCALLPSDRGEDVPISFIHASEAFHLRHCNGPERITGSWWEGRNKTRDYFDVEDQHGRRFWLFQVGETRKWYLHGES